MEISIKHVGLSGLYVKAAGRLDLDSAIEYGTKVKDAIEDSEERINKLELDFLEIIFISSFGLKMILELYKHMKDQGGVLIIKNVSEQIRNSFGLVGFDKFIIFE